MSQHAVLRGGDLLLDLTAHAVHLGDQPMRLTPSEFELLAALMAAPGRAFTRLELLERLQGIAIEGAEHTVNSHIHNLRRLPNQMRRGGRTSLFWRIRTVSL